MKRRIKHLAWGGIKAYLGTKRVHDFGTDAGAAEDWLEHGEWIGFCPDITHHLGEGATFWLEKGETKWKLGCPEWAAKKYPTP